MLELLDWEASVIIMRVVIQKISTPELLLFAISTKSGLIKQAPFGKLTYYTVKQMLKSEINLDACSVTTAGIENGGDHYKPTMELLQARIPVLGEKPISNDVNKARKMVALAKKKRVPYGVNLNHRFTPSAVRAKEWLKKGRLGELNIVNMTMWINNPNESTPVSYSCITPSLLDVMRYFAGDVEFVQAFFKKAKGENLVQCSGKPLI